MFSKTAPGLRRRVFQKSNRGWREGDELREQEYLTEQYRQALAAFRKAESELKQVENECNSAKEALNEKEEYTSALMNYLDSDAEGGQIEANYKKRLMALEQEIREAEVELAAIKSIHHPSVSFGLQKEKAFLTIENQRTRKAIQMVEDQIDNSKRQLASCVVSSRYRQGRELETKHREVSQKKAQLRQTVTQNKNESESAKPVGVPDKSEAARQERNELQKQIEVDLILKKQEDTRKRRERKWDAKLNRMIEDIEELNDRLVDLRMSSFCVDTEALREKYFGGGDEEEEIVGKRVETESDSLETKSDHSDKKSDDNVKPRDYNDKKSDEGDKKSEKKSDDSDKKSEKKSDESEKKSDESDKKSDAEEREKGSEDSDGERKKEDEEKNQNFDDYVEGGDGSDHEKDENDTN